jgi:thiol-disulfide isomerase/thioredoxin
LLAREVVEEMEGKARFVVEDFGASPLAERFGVAEYPAIFVDDALVARPQDFYAWGGPETGKYVPWGEVENRRAFQRDLRRMIEIRLAGGELPALAGGGPAPERRLPEIALRDLAGASFTFADLTGRPVLVEFWATWCPPCLDTLRWLKDLDPAAATVVAIAVESEPDEVAAMVERFSLPGRVVLGDDAVETAFGGLAAVPTLFLADGEGRIVRTFYGAPPDLHQQIEAALAALR